MHEGILSLPKYLKEELIGSCLMVWDTLVVNSISLMSYEVLLAIRGKPYVLNDQLIQHYTYFDNSSYFTRSVK